MKKKNIFKSPAAHIVFFSILLLIGVCVPVFAEEAGETAVSPFYQTFWSLLPPIVAITLALITKEVYSSLFVGLVVGGLLLTNFNPGKTLITIFDEGIVAVLADPGDVCILVFVVILGTMVVLVNKSGGAAAFGRWASRSIHSRLGAQLCTIALGVLIFIDDGFNCMTVGSVMRPITDKHNVSRAKLAYLIDATAAPICIIAPVSSWAAAVSSYVEEGNGILLFIKTIPFNFYALLTIVTMLLLTIFKLDFGPMRKHEDNALKNNDIFSGMKQAADTINVEANPNGKVIDLILPIGVMIVCCIIGMIYTGGFFEGASLIDAFGNCEGGRGLMYGSSVALIFTIIYYLCRRILSFKACLGSIPEGFISMVPPMIILIFAWSLKTIAGMLGIGEYIAQVVNSTAGSFMKFLPAIIFLIGCLQSFATGTSWGTFGILIPITLTIFPLTDPLGVICVSACMAGAVFGDHCSPISDTTIMASAGSRCDHVAHVSTQIPYTITTASVSFVAYIIAGFIPKAYVALPAAIVLMVLTILVIKKIDEKKKAVKAE